jgi:O-acetyl-ADP-ribose deacetylase (regulator of RNase III)/NAD-dependent SIR2 family protein deacetylase
MFLDWNSLEQSLAAVPRAKVRDLRPILSQIQNSHKQKGMSRKIRTKIFLNIQTTSMTPHSTTALKAALLAALRQEAPQIQDQQLPSSVVQQRSLLGDLLIQSNVPWKEETLRLIDCVWAAEATETNVVGLEDLPPPSTTYQGANLTVWRGDITTLQVDAIVNAANDQGLGCFVPSHKCVDNVIHRRAGPRLRQACREVMAARKTPLAAGQSPLVTPAYGLPSRYVFHVTGPQVPPPGRPTSTDEEQLAMAYWNCLEAAAATKDVRSLAFSAISTGLFGFPKEQAAEIAVRTVQQWFEEQQSSSTQLDTIVFDVFAPEDEQIYLKQVEATFGTATLPDLMDTTPDESVRTTTLRLAKKWIDEADAVLICAGAGMSVKPGEMVYTNPKDFARHYPWFADKWNYATGYEGMGLFADRTVPETAKWAYHAQHMDNMRWTFTPNEGYNTLRDMVQDKDYFVLTSNVDACFERTGFSPERIYTPQGEWTYMQCLNVCRPDAVFESRPILDRILPEISPDGFIPEHLVPKCPHCRGPMFGNVRGGGWFRHNKYEEQNAALQNWMAQVLASHKNVVVLEIGAGFNTPTVTRFPVEAFARDAQPLVNSFASTPVMRNCQPISRPCPFQKDGSPSWKWLKLPLF